MTIAKESERIVTEEGRSALGRKEGRKEGGFTAGSQVVAGHGRTISTWRPVPPRWFSSLSSGARDILLSRLLLLLRRRLLLLLQGFVTRARKGRGRESKPNETKHGSLLFAPPPPTRQCGTRAHAHTHTHGTTRLYARIRTCARISTYANASTRIPSRSHPRFFAPFGSTLSYSLFPPFSLHPPPTVGRSLSTSSSNSISPLDRLSRRLSCTSSVSFLRLVSSPRSPSVSLLRPSCSLARTTYQLGG